MRSRVLHAAVSVCAGHGLGSLQTVDTYPNANKLFSVRIVPRQIQAVAEARKVNDVADALHAEDTRALHFAPRPPCPAPIQKGVRPRREGRECRQARAGSQTLLHASLVGSS